MGPFENNSAFAQVLVRHQTSDKALAQTNAEPICWHIYAKLGDNELWNDASHIEARTKWLPYSRRHFQMDFLEWKCINFDLIVY